MKVLIIGALPSSLVNFRGSLIRSIVEKGHKVFTAANGCDPGTEAKLRTLGAAYYPIRITRAGMNPFADLITLFDLVRLMRRIRPDLVLNYTIKPIIYGGLAAWFCGVRNIFSMIEGLGHVFMPQESLPLKVSAFIARILYRIGLSGAGRVFFLNPDDLNQLVNGLYVSERRAVLLNGIGIDLSHYSREPLSDVSRFHFLMVARLLKEKGISEFVEAARIVREKYPNVEFMLAGERGEKGSSIKREELESWQREGVICYMGHVDDVRLLYRDCHVFVLPSYYREGTPRTSLEALAAGRPVITTDAPGCRETVSFSEGGSVLRTEEGAKDLKIGRNGILVPVKDAAALAAAMEFFIEYPEQIARKGDESRRYAEERYDVHKVNAVILREMGFDR